MRRFIPWAAIALLLLIVSPGYAQEIVIVGTGSGPPILKAIGEAFSRQHPDVTITVPRSIGSGGGIKAVGNDEYLLARVAREIKEKEKHYNLSYTPIAKMPIVFFANPNVALTNLSATQVCDIYSGTIFSWKEVGGHPARIRVIRRQDGDSSLSVLLRSFPGFSDIRITPYSKTTYSDPDTFAMAETTPDAIAFGAYCDVMRRPLTVFAIDTVAPTDKAYPHFGTFGLVYKEKSRTGVIKQFIEFATSAKAHNPIRQSGGLPIE